MSLAGQVLCQRMLVAPCALTMLGAATVAAAPAAAVFRKWRRLEVVSFLDVVMFVSPFAGDPFGDRALLFYCEARQRLAQGFGKNVRNDATLRRGLIPDLVLPPRTLVWRSAQIDRAGPAQGVAFQFDVAELVGGRMHQHPSRRHAAPA